jgi:hypothetical protein
LISAFFLCFRSWIPVTTIKSVLPVISFRSWFVIILYRQALYRLVKWSCISSWWAVDSKSHCTRKWNELFHPEISPLKLVLFVFGTLL